MAIQEIKQISIRKYLEGMGILPAKDKSYYGMYNSPFREDKNASLKVDYQKNLWIDYGANEGGTLIDLVMRMEQCSLNEAITRLERIHSHANVGAYQCANTPTGNFSFQRKKIEADTTTKESSITIKKVQPISDPSLIDYLNERHINIDMARIHCSEVHYTVNGKSYYAVGFQNDKGGYELRSKYFKGCTSKYITSVKRNKDQCLLFEGFMDYLSFLAINKLQNSPIDVIVLNSLVNLSRAEKAIASYKKVWAFLDNDQAARKAVLELKSICNNVNDQSRLYSMNKDLNEYLCNKQQVIQDEKMKRPGLKR